MEDIFRALIQGEQPPSGAGATRGGGLESLLQGFLGGGQSPAEPAQGAPDFGGLLGGLLGGGAAPGVEAPAPAEPLQGAPDFGGLLGGLLGGGAAQGTGAGQGTPDIGSLLGGLLGGPGGLPGGAGQPSTGGGLGGVLGAILGGGSPVMESDGFTASIASGLAGKLGLPAWVAQAVVAFVLGKLLNHRLQPEAAAAPRRSRRAQPQAAGLDGVLAKMNSGQRVKRTDLRSTGLAAELAEHTGLDRATAEASLQQVLNSLGGQLAG